MTVTLEFSVSSQAVQQDLVTELNLHDDVVARAETSSGTYVVMVECPTTSTVIWEIRALVKTFDEALTPSSTSSSASPRHTDRASG
jgi:hypothetical protein